MADDMKRHLLLAAALPLLFVACQATPPQTGVMTADPRPGDTAMEFQREELDPLINQRPTTTQLNAAGAALNARSGMSLPTP